ncbi:uncharacterized protein [Dermacentor andersoni]|uniref:uncharacterized protein n=1 Tax=Dermacentor andersoni TaxID=34620 RepID=UPI003B3B12A1
MSILSVQKERWAHLADRNPWLACCGNCSICLHCYPNKSGGASCPSLTIARRVSLVQTHLHITATQLGFSMSSLQAPFQPSFLLDPLAMDVISFDADDTYSMRYDFNHTTSSPRYPQSNGLAEKDLLQWNPDHHLAKYFKEDDYRQCCPTSGPAQAAAYRSIVRPTVAADEYHHSTPETRYASKKGSGPPKVKSFKLRHIPVRIT